MDMNRNDDEWIDRYINGSLTAGEKEWVELRLATDPQFKQLYEERRILIDGIRYAHLLKNLIELRKQEKKLPPLTVLLAELQNEIRYMDWVDGQLTRGLSDEEAAWIKEMETQEPAAEKIQQGHQSLINNIRQAHLHEKVMQLRTLEKSVSQTEQSFRNGSDLNTWKPWTIAIAAAALISFTFLFVVEPSPNSMDCIVSISGFNQCF
jgi:hypothetical protein